jgi:hypothetical protein
MFRGETNTAFLKFIVMIIFTLALNLLCSAGLGIISWFIVFIPFILMTYITTVLAFAFGIPKKDNLRPERKSREDHERERNHDIVGGCAGTRYGCCYDGVTAKVDDRGSNCPHKPRPKPEPKPPHKKGCAGEQYGCCEDGTTTRPCPKGMFPIFNSSNGVCANSEFGCCSDGKTTAIAPQCKGETSPVI